MTAPSQTADEGGEVLISAIVCTRHRPALLADAIASVLAQDLTGLPGVAIELLVVDDSSDPPAVLPLLPPVWSGQTRLLRTTSGSPSRARQIGVDAATGDILAFCDDDDRWRPRHLATLLPVLLADPRIAAVAGRVEPEPAARPEDEDANRAIDRQPEDHPSAILLRLAAVRDAGGFDLTLPAHEVVDLWNRLGLVAERRRVPIVVATVGVGPDRVGARPDPATTDYVRLATRRRRSQIERATQIRSRAGPVQPVGFDPGTWSDANRRLLWQASTVGGGGSFGIVAERLIRALTKLGVTIEAGPLRRSWPEWLHRCLERPADLTCLGFHYDGAVGPSAVACERLVCYTMWESTLVAREKIKEINRHVSLLCVPSRQNAAVYAARGVRVPIRVLPHGVDPAAFPLLARPPRATFTFGTFGDLSARKGVDVLVRAFRAEFRADEPVRLLLKHAKAERTPYIMALQRAADGEPRIELRSGFDSSEAVLAYLGELDAFVLPSRGEGFGLTGLEAMATGLPLIATNWSGPADYLNPVDTLPLGYRLVPAGGAKGASNVRYFGEWAEPDEAELRERLRWCFDHPGDAVATGRAAAGRVRRDWGWEQPARQLLADLDALAAGLSPA